MAKKDSERVTVTSVGSRVADCEAETVIENLKVRVCVNRDGFDHRPVV